MTDAYSRLYHRFPTEFPSIFADDQALAAWVRLLLLADASWPMRPPLPRSIRRKALVQLEEAGLLEVTGDTYTVRGLEAERTRRRNAARIGAAQRWQSDGNANADATAMPRRDETSTRREEQKEKTPPPPAKRGLRKNKTNPRSLHGAPRQTGTNPRANGASPRQEREAQKREPLSVGHIFRGMAAVAESEE